MVATYVLFPMSQPDGADCIINVYETDDQKTGIIVFIRLINLLSVGFFAYADPWASSNY